MSESSYPERNPAEEAARIAMKRIYSCLDQGNSFVLEAGAGAGKTYSLIQALHHLIEQRGRELGPWSSFRPN